MMFLLHRYLWCLNFELQKTIDIPACVLLSLGKTQWRYRFDFMGVSVDLGS